MGHVPAHLTGHLMDQLKNYVNMYIKSRVYADLKVVLTFLLVDLNWTFILETF